MDGFLFHEINLLKSLAQEHLVTLKRNGSPNQTYGLSNIQVEGYSALLFTLQALINVCILALDNKEFSNCKTVVEPEVHLQTVLELATQLISLKEGAVLDHLGSCWGKRVQLRPRFSMLPSCFVGHNHKSSIQNVNVPPSKNIKFK